MNIDPVVNIDPVARSIALYGAVVATAALLWNIYVGLRDRPGVRVRVSQGFFPGANMGPMIFIVAINKGRRPLTLTGVGLRLPNHNDIVFVRPNLPIELGEGKSHQEWISQDELRQYLLSAGYKAPPLFAWYRDATGRIYRGRVRHLGLIKSIAEHLKSGQP